MRTVLASRPRPVASLAVGALVLAGLLVTGPQRPATADSAPSDPATPTTVAADGLPTVQIDGVAWSQAIVGGRVYVAGQFTTARPAGAAAGTQTVTRSNLLAYDLETGVLVSSWAPALNGAAYAIAGSADGTRIYVGGDFTRVNNVAQNRFVVLDATTGARISGFNPNPDSTVRAITSTPSTIYFGGRFNSVAGNSRPRLAAISATTGALLSWRASAQAAQVDAMIMSPDRSRVIVGGRFERLSNVAALGSGALSASNAAVLRWDANKIVTNWGYDAGIESLTSDGSLIFGSGFAFLGHNGGYGNLEGTFAAEPNTGEIVWVEDCHGDTYSVYADAAHEVIYAVGHPHYCANIGSFSDSAWRFALAFSTKDVSTITPNTVPNYYDWQGFRAPANLNFFPDMTGGIFTGSGQAAWSVSGSGDYVTFAGEFLTVGGVAQQGLVRMAMAPKSTNKQGLRVTGSELQPAGSSQAAGTAQVSWPTNWDRDNETLTYSVLRDGSNTPLYTTTANSTWWERPRVSFTDTGLVNGRSYSYRIRQSDPFGNTTTSPSVSVTAGSSSAGSLGAYALGVMNDNPAAYWRLGDTSGSTQDWTGYGDSPVGSGVVRGVPGALSGDTNRAARFTGTSSSRINGNRSTGALNHVSLEAWIKTTSTAGGRIVGFGNTSSGSSTNADRHLYLGTDGRLNFGVRPAITRVITTPDAYNDGQWHHVVGTLGTTGMRLYVDGDLTAERADAVSAGVYSGYWRIGGDAMSSWPGAGGDNFVGDIDDVAIYGRAITPAEVAAHHTTGTGGVVPNQPPSARFIAIGGDFTASVDGSSSIDLDGTIESYAWNFGDGETGTGATVDHPYTSAGTKTITLTVTDDDGAVGSVSHQVEVTDPNANNPPVASFTATPSGLTVAVDATATTDDGKVASYGWTFGDGGTGTGVTASHTYAAAGTYPITLTATDDDGAPGSATRSVTVAAAPTVLASDAFARTVASGFGTADLGGVWSTTGSSSVTGGAGRFTLAGQSSLAESRLAGVTGTSLLTQVTENWNKRPSGSGGWFLVRGRINSAGEYRLKIGHKATGSVTARVVRASATGAETAVTSEAAVPGLTYTAGTPIAAKFNVSGTSPTVLQAKVWLATGTEPAAWFIDTSDATAALQGPGYTGLAALNSSTTTNGPVLVGVDNFTVARP